MRVERVFDASQTDPDREAALIRSAQTLARRRARSRALYILTIQIAVALIVIGAWQFASGRWIDSLFFSAPDRIFAAFRKLVVEGTLWWHLQVTLVEMALGYLVGVTLGIGAALLVWSIPFGEPIVRPMALAAFATPKVALAPLIVIWFGIDLGAKVVVAASLVFFIVYFNSLVGFAAASPNMISLMRLMKAPNSAIFRKLILPSATPYIFTAMRMTLPAALIGAILGEFLSSSRGIGYLIAAASSRYDTGAVFAGIFSLVIFVLVPNALLSRVERYLLRWRASDRFT